MSEEFDPKAVRGRMSTRMGISGRYDEAHEALEEAESDLKAALNRIEELDPCPHCGHHRETNPLGGMDYCARPER